MDSPIFGYYDQLEDARVWEEYKNYSLLEIEAIKIQK